MRETIVIPARQLIVKRERLFPDHSIIATHNHMEIRILGNLLLCRRHNQGLAGNSKVQNSNLKKVGKTGREAACIGAWIFYLFTAEAQS